MTVDELAGLVGTTDNSVRSHLASLERDGLVKQEGVRRGAGAGKPAVLYALHPAAELEISSAYPPVLMAVVDAIIRELPADEAERLLRVVGHDLARSVGGRAAGDRRERIDAAARVLVALGGDVEVVEEGTALVIRGFGCPPYPSTRRSAARSRRSSPTSLASAHASAANTASARGAVSESRWETRRPGCDVSLSRAHRGRSYSRPILQPADPTAGRSSAA